MNGKASAALAAATAILVLGPFGAALAEKAPEDPVEKRFQSIEKQLRQLREIVLQAKDTGQPVQVRISTEPDPTLDALTQRMDDFEQSARTRNNQIDGLSHDLEQARKADADDKAQIKALEDRLAADEAKLKAIDDAQHAAAAAAAAPALAEGAAPTGSGPAATPAPPPSTADAADAFKHANQLLREGDYVAASNAFSGFVETYGDTPYGPEARYWLGETLYVRGQYADAAAAYIGAIRGYPQTPWAADAMLKLARALIALNKPVDACHALDEMGRRYPGAPPTAKAKAREIRAAAKCAA